MIRSDLAQMTPKDFRRLANLDVDTRLVLPARGNTKLKYSVYASLIKHIKTRMIDERKYGVLNPAIQNRSVTIPTGHLLYSQMVWVVQELEKRLDNIDYINFDPMQFHASADSEIWFDAKYYILGINALKNI